MWYMHRTKIIASVAALVAIIAGVVAFLVLGGKSDSPADQIAAIAASEKAWLDNRSAEPIVTVAPTKQNAILPGQSLAPTRRLEAPGKCGAALESGRKLMTTYPSGLMPEAAEPMNAVFKQLDTDCPKDIAANFRSQEMINWMNMAIPVTAGAKPAATK